MTRLALTLALLLSSSPAVVASAGSPSPSGLIAYIEKDGGTTRLMTMRPDGSGARPVGHLRDVDAPAWSPDGRRLAVVSDSQIYVLGADGNGATRVTFREGWKGSPSWSTDGMQIAYEALVLRENYGQNGTAGSGHFTCELRIVDLRTHRERTLLAAGEVRNVYWAGPGWYVDPGCAQRPRWSPTGEWIAFMSSSGADAADGSPGDVRVIRPDGTGERVVVTGTAGYAAAWSPDGRRLAFFDNEIPSTRPAVRTIRVDGTDPRRVGVIGGSETDVMAWPEGWLSYAPDGRALMVCTSPTGDDNYQLFRAPIDGSPSVQVTRGPDSHLTPDWRP